MRTSKLTFLGTLMLAAAFAGAGWSQPSNVQSVSVPPSGGAAVPQAGPNAAQLGARNYPQIGAVNYVEGRAQIDGQALLPGSVGSVVLQKGQMVTTEDGRVEILLTPGVFLRLADNSTVQMVSPSLAPTEVALQKGRAMIEVDYISGDNNIRIDQNGASAKLLKKGLYEFDADSGQVRTFKGKAEVYVGPRSIKLDEGDQIALNTGANPKAKGFKAVHYEDDFYAWCHLRSGYIQEANNQLAASYGNDSNGYGYPGWYWDPWLDAWAFPYGWGLGFYGAPFYGGLYGPGFYGGGFGYRGYAGRGFARGGGFHGGGFGFHGGGGGGFHGGGGGHR